MKLAVLFFAVIISIGSASATETFRGKLASAIFGMLYCDKVNGFSETGTFESDCGFSERLSDGNFRVRTTYKDIDIDVNGSDYASIQNLFSLFAISGFNRDHDYESNGMQSAIKVWYWDPAQEYNHIECSIQEGLFSSAECTISLFR